jgi:hypothetical protein
MRTIRNVLFSVTMVLAFVAGDARLAGMTPGVCQLTNCHCSSYGEDGFVAWCDWEEGCPYSGSWCDMVREDCPSGEAWCDAEWCDAVCEPTEGEP